jgi:hypothetical protein
LLGGGGFVAHSIEIASTITLATGGVTINGPGGSNLAITAVEGNFRAISSPGALTVNNLQVKYAQPNKNVSAYYGGCIYAKNTLTLAGVQLTHCYLTNTGSAKGGAAASFLGEVDLDNVDIVRTAAVSTTSGDAMGGAVYAFNDVDMIDSSIYPGAGGKVNAYVTGSSGNALGGAIHSGGSVYMSDSVISTARAKVSSTTGGTASGGAIWARGAVSVTDVSKIVGASANTAAVANSYGGAIYSASAVSLYGSSVTGSTTTSGNSFLSKGGGIFAKGFTSASYGYIASNSSGIGGGINATSGFASYYSYFWNNNAALFGGAVDLSAGLANVRGTTVTYNSAGLCCSGLDLNVGGANSVKVTQSTFAQNTGTAALYAHAFSTRIYNSTFVYNASSSSTMSGVFVSPGNSGSTLTIASNLMSGNSYGASAMQNDFHVESGVTVGGDHNLIRTPGTAAPGDTISGKCPLLYPGELSFFNKQAQFTIRHEVKSPATNAGSNPLNLKADQRGGAAGATSPPRVSGEPATTALPDIGAYEINESDEVFDNRFEGCS